MPDTTEFIVSQARIVSWIIRRRSLKIWNNKKDILGNSLIDFPPSNPNEFASMISKPNKKAKWIEIIEFNLQSRLSGINESDWTKMN